MNYRNRINTLICTSLGLFIVPFNVDAGEIELSDEVNVKLSRIKSKSRQMQHTSPEDYISSRDKREEMFDNNTSDCGELDIGNIESSERPSFGPQKVDVIIVGDVINTDNRC